MLFPCTCTKIVQGKCMHMKSQPTWVAYFIKKYFFFSFYFLKKLECAHVFPCTCTKIMSTCTKIMKGKYMHMMSQPHHPTVTSLSSYTTATVTDDNATYLMYGALGKQAILTFNTAGNSHIVTLSIGSFLI